MNHQVVACCLTSCLILYSDLLLSWFSHAGQRNPSCPLISPQRRITATCLWMAVSPVRAARKDCSCTIHTVTCCAQKIQAGAAHSPGTTWYYHLSPRYTNTKWVFQMKMREEPCDWCQWIGYCYKTKVKHGSLFSWVYLQYLNKKNTQKMSTYVPTATLIA